MPLCAAVLTVKGVSASVDPVRSSDMASMPVPKLLSAPDAMRPSAPKDTVAAGLAVRSTPSTNIRIS